MIMFDFENLVDAKIVLVEVQEGYGGEFLQLARWTLEASNLIRVLRFPLH